jgi:hypothetical protein
MKRTFLAISLLCLLCVGGIFGQVSDVKYILRYDTISCRYDVYFKVIAGAATSRRQTSQFNSSVSFVVPRGTTVSVAQSFRPIKDDGGISAWIPSSQNEGPAVTPTLSYFSFIPTLSPTAFYNTLDLNEEVKIFSVNVSPLPTNCGSSLRFFRNNIIQGEPVDGGDPPSSAPGMNGGDFNNGFSIGGGAQIFTGTLENQPPKVTNTSILATCSNGLEIDLFASVPACQRPLRYSWTGPSGFTSTMQDVNLPNASETASGLYSVVIEDALGCKDTLEINAQAKPRAGANISACSGASTPALTGTNSASGTWTSLSPLVQVGPTVGGVSNVTSIDPTASGTLSLVYTVNTCSDTVALSVGAADAGPDVNPIACFSNGVASLNAVGTGTWTLAPGNPGTAIFSSPNSPTSNLSSFSVAGTYKVYWTSGGCFDSLSINVGAACACPIAGNTITETSPTFCGLPSNFAITGNAATPNTGIYQWQVSLNGGAFTNASGNSTSKDYTPTGLASGTYRFKRLYTLPSEANCVNESNEVGFVLTITPGPPTGLTASPNPSCVGTPVIINATGEPGAIFAYTISSPQGGSTTSTSNSATFTSLAQGSYTVSVTQSVNGCLSTNASVSYTVEPVPATPTSAVGNNPSACQGSDGSILLNGLTPNASYTVTYRKNGTSASTTQRVAANGSLTIPGLTSGNYSNFVISTPLGCQSSLNQTVTLNEPNAPAAPGNIQAIPNPVCLGQQIQFTTTGLDGATFNWTASAPAAGLRTSTTNANSMVATLGGTYTISVSQSVGGCISVPATIQVTVNSIPTPTLSVIPNPACIGDLVNFEAVGNVPNGTYTWSSNNPLLTLPLAVSSPTGSMLSLTPTDAGSYIISVTQNIDGCASNPATTTLNVRNCKNSKIGNFVWNDLNANGIQNSGEPGIKDVIVGLFREDGILVKETYSGNNGEYQFLDVIPGNYYMRYRNTTLKVTDPNIGSNDAVDSDVTGTFGAGTTDLFTIIAGEDNNNVDAGFYVCNKIGNLVWYDDNRNDIWDVIENGINGLTVNLYRTDGGRRLFATTETGKKPGSPSDDGWFEFCAPPGSYFIEVVLPPQGLVTARPNIGTNRFIDSDITARNGPGTTNTFTIVAGQDKLDVGAGYYPMATAGNLVWFDENVNGLQDTWETKLNNVKIEAFDVESNVKIAEAFTNTEGVYKIDYLKKEEVYFKITPPDGLAPTMHISDDKMNSDIDNSFGYNTTRAIKMSSGEDNQNIDFGLAFSALPLKWEYVKASSIDEGHNIEWKTSSELNVDYFVIEKSLNGSEFEIISPRIRAKNIFNGQNNYNFININTSEKGEYLYRVKQVDFDGSHETSKLVGLEEITSFATIDIYPNPTIDVLNVKFDLATESEVKVTFSNILGQILPEYSSFQNFTPGNHVMDFKLSTLPSGLYQIMIEYDNKKIVKEIVKN